MSDVGKKVLEIVVGLVFLMVGIFFFTILAPTTATQIVTSNTTNIAKLPGGTGLVTLYQFTGTIFILGALISFALAIFGVGLHGLEMTMEVTEKELHSLAVALFNLAMYAVDFALAALKYTMDQAVSALTLSRVGGLP